MFLNSPLTTHHSPLLESLRTQVRGRNPRHVGGEDHVEGPVESDPGFAEKRGQLKQVVGPPQEPTDQTGDRNAEDLADSIPMAQRNQFAFGAVGELRDTRISPFSARR